MNQIVEIFLILQMYKKEKMGKLLLSFMLHYKHKFQIKKYNVFNMVC